MKRIIAFTMLAVLVAAPAFAAVATTRHDMVTFWTAGPRQGVCSYCHTPHSAQGARLWPATPNAGIQTTWGLIAALCYSCHGPGVTLGTATLNDVTATVYNGAMSQHPLRTIAGTSPNTNAAATGWPYTPAAGATTPMECSSCHDVHNQTAASVATLGDARNFLRGPHYVGTAAVPTNMYCTRCHTGRLAVGSMNGTAGGNDATHPVGNLVTDGRSGTAGTVAMGVAAYNVAYGTQGGHRAATAGNTGGVVCVTCHRPHGAAPKALVVNNYTTGTGVSQLCQDCHGTTPSLDDAANTRTTHPVNVGTGDDISTGGQTLSILRPLADALGVTIGSFVMDAVTGVGGTNGTIVCMSCHQPHEAYGQTQILRREKISVGDGICNDCHGAVFAGFASHPINVTMTNEDTGVWPNKDLLPLRGGNIVCDTCHAGHNGAVGTNPYLLRVLDNYSEICIGCHTPTASNAPIFAVGGSSANPSTYIREELYSGNFSAGVGARLGTHPAHRAINTTAPNDHSTWRVTLGAGGTYNPSSVPLGNHYGTNGSTMICQSCHTPHGAAPTGGWHGTVNSMDLLYVPNGRGTARTGPNGNAPAAQYSAAAGDTICQACHVPAGTHPVQSWTVTRSGAACNTASAYVNTVGQPVAPTDYTVTGAIMTCESCHAPHAAFTATGSFILEAGASTAPSTTGGEKPTSWNRDTLCALCHNY